MTSFDLFFYVGGYWSTDDTYHGGEAHQVGRIESETFSLNSVTTYVTELYGYDENMRKVSWFPPETPDKKEDVDDDEMLRKVVHYSLGSGAMTLYIVREDDPYLGRRIDTDLGYLGTSLDGESSSSDSDVDDGVNDNNASDGEEEEEEQHDSSSRESDVGHLEIDESKYQKFRVGQEYMIIQSFKSVIAQYAVKKRRDIKYDKSDSKRVVAKLIRILQDT